MPIERGFRVRLLSPVGHYPVRSFFSKSAALIISPEVCFSIARIRGKDWSFSEADSLTRLELPLYGSVLLSGKAETPYCYPYPTSVRVELEAEPDEEIGPNVPECRSYLLEEYRRCELDIYSGSRGHKPPVLGGEAYSLVAEADENEQLQMLNRLMESDEVLLRGVSCILKAGMAFQYREFGEAACIYLWIALDAAHSIVLQRLRKSGVANPTSADAARYFERVSGYGTDWEKFFEDDYENRIRAIHPDNRFGAEAIPQFLIDDFLELKSMLIPLFQFLIDDTPDTP
jgi:hypothetical protein